MKTLIFNGSPRKNGNCSFCVKYISENLNGEINTVSAYEKNISPCTDCRYCVSSKKCAVNDDMQKLYDYIISADNIIIVSPLYFSTLTGELLSLLSRIQFFYNAKITPKEKKGVLVFLGGGTSKNLEPAYLTGRVILRQLNCKNIEYISYTNTDNAPASTSGEFLQKLSDICKNISAKMQ